MKKCITLCLIVSLLATGVFSFGSLMPVNAATAENIEYVTAEYFTSEPYVDGCITEAEWGDITFEVDGYDVATSADTVPYSRFLYWRVGNVGDYRDMHYAVRLRWSENYFWIGVTVDDIDGHSLKNGTTDTWNGDALQVRIDKDGPNAVTFGDEFSITEEHSLPWGNTLKVPDFLFGYVEIAGGFSEAWENTSNMGMTSFSDNPKGAAKCVVAPCGSDYSEATRNGVTTYEIAIPWSYILTDTGIESLTYSNYTIGRHGNLTGGIGRDFGVSMVVLDNGINTDTDYDAFLAWGSGVCGIQQTEGANSVTGSNSVVLSSDTVTPAETYEKHDPSALLDAKFSKENIDKKGVFYDYLGGDKGKENALSYDELSVLTYDKVSDLDFWGGSFKGKITNIGGTHGNVLDYSKFYGLDKSEAASDTQTYIDTRKSDTENNLFPTSYTLDFDIKYTDTAVVSENHATSLYNWFGGPRGISYHCGYFFGAGEFRIVRADDRDYVVCSKPYDLIKDRWYNWKFQFDNESCTARLWIDDLTTEEDNRENEWGELIFDTNMRYFYYSSEEIKSEGSLLPFGMMNTQCMYDNVKIYNFATPGVEKEVLYGDLNHDGNITSIDANLIIKILSGVLIPDEEMYDAADVNRDESVSPIDSSLITRMIAFSEY